jgi:Transglutaminase-like superfamily
MVSMKWPVSIWFIFIAIPAFSQRARVDFTEIDRRVQFIKPAPPAELTKQLTSFCSTDLEKVRAIFRWITENIDYKIKQPAKRKKNDPVIYDESNDTGEQKSLDERVAETVLEKRVAFCDGYARLFKTLCSYAGIRAELIVGYARTESNKINQRFRSNHTWNAVLIDNVWRLLDVTWASGFVTWNGDTYIRQFDEEYFLTPPDQFIHEHYPDDMHWTLMTDPPLMTEFRQSPYKQRTFIKYTITAYRPAGGVIEVNLGDTVQVELETADAERDRHIGGDPFLDTTIYSTPTSALLVPSVVLTNKIAYRYHVTSPAIEWLYIYYNDDVILRYKLAVRDKTSMAVTIFK